MRQIFRNKYVRLFSILLAGVLIGWFIKPSQKETATSSSETKSDQIWTCSMHPQIRLSEPGQCPICGMDLIPLNLNSDDDNSEGILMSEKAMELAGVRTIIAGYQNPNKEIRLPGKIQADERKVYSQVTHIPGRIEKLLVNFTGETIKAGQTIALIYSPELVSAQVELFEASKIKEQQPLLYEAAKEKLKNWKLTDSQINQIIADGKPKQSFPIQADVSGIVLSKKVNNGDYVSVGMNLFEIVDLSTVWVLFNVYENDLMWVKSGDKVDFTVASIPGQKFEGKISFIDPVIDPMTRVANARVEVSNPGLRLKPEMFATGMIQSKLADKKKVLAIPKSAVMWTGERSVVYEKISSENGVRFVMREVLLGPSLGNSYIINSGIESGDEIAINGTFSIDAASQLASKPSMMNPEGGEVITGHNHGGTSSKTNGSNKTLSEPIAISNKVKNILLPLFNEYTLMKDALVADDFQKSKQIASSLLTKLTKINMSEFTGEAHNIWMKHSNEIEKALMTINKAENIGEVRKQFNTLSDQFIMLAVTFGPFEKELYILHCPMANDNKGADWISNEKKIQNPYFGESMIGCGAVTKEIK